MSNEYKRNHFVPRGYLKGFTNNQNKIFRLIINPTQYQTPIIERVVNQVGYVMDLYTITNEIIYELYDIPEDDKYIEKNCFTQIENHIGQTIQNIADKKVTEDDRKMICDFILLSITRHPKNIELFKKEYSPQFHEDFLEDKKEAIEESKKFYGDTRSFEEIKTEYLKQVKEDKKFNVDNLAKSYLHQILLDFALDPNNVRRQIFRHNIWRQFRIYESVEENEFITSNYPAYSFQHGVGFNDNILPTSFYMIPLNKRLILEIDGEPCREDFHSTPIWKEVDNNMVDFMNYFTLQNSEGEIYCSNRKQLERYGTDEYHEIYKPQFDKLIEKNKNYR